MKEKESEQTNYTGDLEKNSSKKKIIISISIAVLLIIIIALLILLTRKVPQYTITFDSKGGSFVEKVIVSENNKIPEPGDPTKEGYEFAGWYYNDELYDFDKLVTCDMTLEARWAVAGNSSGNTTIQKDLTLKVGDTFNVSELIENVEEEITNWEISEPDIISIDANGNGTALKEGTVTITVNPKYNKYTITVNIENSTNNEQPSENTPVGETTVKVTGISLNKTKLNLTQGQSSKLTATVKPTNATNKNVIWKSSNSSVVSVDSNGNIKALKVGSATITVTTKDGGYTAEAKIEVGEAASGENVVKVKGVTLNKTELTLTEGNKTKLTATVNPGDATNKNVTWESSNSSIVSVDSNGNIKALKAGSATITVTTKDGNYKATCRITVKEKEPVYSIEIQ